MRIFIRPIDTQFHRSGLPFDAGTDTEVGVLFPPFPRTIYGAMRAKGMSEADGDLAIGKKLFNPGDIDRYGNGERFGSLRMIGPILARTNSEGRVDHDIFFPFPLDLLARKEDGNMTLLSPAGFIPGAGWDLADVALGIMDQQGSGEALSGDEVKSLNAEYFLPYEHLRRYLAHKIGPENDEAGHYGDGAADRLFCMEERIGIGRDNFKRTARESMLYSIPHCRMVDGKEGACGFYIHIEDTEGRNLKIPRSGFLQLGGDFRAASYAALDQDDSERWWENHAGAVEKLILKRGRFKAFLITPAIFERGCVPDDATIEEQEGNGSKQRLVALDVQLGNGQTVKFGLRGACIGRPKLIGGWNIQARKPKSVRKAVPEGSVYFFEAQGWDAYGETEKRDAVSRIFEKYNFQPWCTMEPWKDLSEYGPGREGFGIALIGGW